ncbi:MAG: VWA domain-containing protein [Planctomycetaceae bacterium]
MKLQTLHRNSQRRGAAAVLVVAMLFVFLVSAALTVDVAYMQLIRTDLRIATDAAAQAAAETLARTEDASLALAAAKEYAALNQVAGAPLQIADSDVTFGRIVEGTDGKWQFQAGATPPNSVRVAARLADDAATHAVPLFFAPALGQDNFTTQQSAVAAQQDVEVCLALDRSGSMLFDMSGVDYSYPTGNPKLSSFTAWGPVWQNHLSAPHPTKSRWAVLAGAVDLFLSEAGNYRQPPRISLVTWGSDYTMPISPYTKYSAATIDSKLPSKTNASWSTETTSVKGSVSTLGSKPMMGGTNMSAGLDAAVAQVTGTQSSSYANKIIILLTDGVWNEGRDPLLAAQDARAKNITVHTVSMLSTDQSTMRQIAEITGGRSYVANDTDQLRQAFYELARTLPVVLTE